MQSNAPINYQIMQPSTEDGFYYPDYDAMIRSASSVEEATFLLIEKKANWGFGCNMIYVTRQRCGHFETFQIQQDEKTPIPRILADARKHAEKFKCSHCLLEGWKT